MFLRFWYDIFHEIIIIIIIIIIYICIQNKREDTGN